MNKIRCFTLIELLITVALLGAMACIVLPKMSSSRDKAIEKSMAPYEMKQIKVAFEEFISDCCPTDSDFELIARYGLEVLVEYRQTKSPLNLNVRGWSFSPSYNYDRGKGWRGPYLVGEDKLLINASLNGQKLQSSGGAEIPVVCDPYYSRKQKNNYYRVISLNKELLLIFVGVDGELGDYENGTKDDTSDDETDNIELVLATL